MQLFQSATELYPQLNCGFSDATCTIGISANDPALAVKVFIIQSAHQAAPIRLEGAVSNHRFQKNTSLQLKLHHFKPTETSVRP